MKIKKIILFATCATLVSGPVLAQDYVPNRFESIKNFIKKPITIFAIAGIAIPTLYYYYEKSRIREQKLQNVALFFDEAKKSFELRISGRKSYSPFLELANVIGNKDIELLKKMSNKELEKKFDFSMSQNISSGTLQMHIVCQSAISLVIFRSALDKTDEEELKTLRMLRVLFEKNIAPYKQTGSVKDDREVYFIKFSASDFMSYDYIEAMSLLEMAEKYSSDYVQKLLKEYIKSYKRVS